MSEAIKITLVGDLMLGDGPFSRGIGINSVLSAKGADYFFKGIKDLLIENDMLVGNLEGPVVPRLTRYKKPLIVNESFIPALKDIGFKYLSVANNHFADFGIEGIDYTLKVLDKYGIKALGLKDLTNNISLIKDKTVNILAADILPNHHIRKSYPIPPPIVTGSLSVTGEWICQVIEKSGADYKLVYLHWGEEFMHYPDPFQVEWAHRFIDSGASAVVGTHPHVPQRVERYNEGIIAYSLGNFVSDMSYPPTKLGYMLTLSLREDQSVDFEIIPYRLNTNFVPELMSDDEKQKFIDDLENLPESVLNIDDRRIGMDFYRKKALAEENAMWKWAKLFYLRNFFRYPLSVHIEILKDKFKANCVSRS